MSGGMLVGGALGAESGGGGWGVLGGVVIVGGIGYAGGYYLPDSFFGSLASGGSNGMITNGTNMGTGTLGGMIGGGAQWALQQAGLSPLNAGEIAGGLAGMLTEALSPTPNLGMGLATGVGGAALSGLTYMDLEKFKCPCGE